jgi:hypothetical protein
MVIEQEVPKSLKDKSAQKHDPSDTYVPRASLHRTRDGRSI